MSFNPASSSDAPVSENALRAFHGAVTAHFKPFADELGLAWQIACPWIEGFSTPVIQVTIRICREDYPNVIVLLRPNITPAPLASVDCFGLSWVEEYVAGKRSHELFKPCWEPETIVAEVERLSEQFRRFALPLITSESTDWTDIQRYVLSRVEANIAATLPRYRSHGSASPICTGRKGEGTG